MAESRSVDESENRSARDPEADAIFGRGYHEKAYMVELGHRLRTLREERGLTQQALGRAAGVATDMVSRLENGHYSSPGLRTLLRIAEGIGLPVAGLLPDVDRSPHASPESALRARLIAMAQRVELEDLELMVEIATAIAGRRQRH